MFSESFIAYSREDPAAWQVARRSRKGSTARAGMSTRTHATTTIQHINLRQRGGHGFVPTCPPGSPQAMHLQNSATYLWSIYKDG